jgi:hypothetical protein
MNLGDDTLLHKLWLHVLEVIVDEVHHGFIYETLNSFTTDDSSVDDNEHLRYGMDFCAYAYIYVRVLNID